MNPWDLSASDLMIWGLVAHLIADWPLQNDWMAKNKMKRANLTRRRRNQPDHPLHPFEDIYNGTLWAIRHPAAYVHAGIHTVFLALIFGWVAIPLGIAHLIIDCRWIIVWWSTKVIKQTQPSPVITNSLWTVSRGSVMDLGTEVRFWTDQVFHIACVAVAALLVTL